MDDSDECFDLDNFEYASDFRAPTDQSSGEVVAMIQGGSLDRARFRCGSLGGWRGKAGYSDSRANSGLARRREFARNAREQDTAKPSRPRRNPALISQQACSELGGLTPNLRGMSTMDPFALPSMPSERCHKPPQKPPRGRAL